MSSDTSASVLQKQKEAAQAAMAAKRAKVSGTEAFTASATLEAQKANAASIVGLFSIDEWRKAQKEADAREAAAAVAGGSGSAAPLSKPARAAEKRPRALLSFGDDEEEEEDGAFAGPRGRGAPGLRGRARPDVAAGAEASSTAPPPLEPATAEPDAKRPRLMKDPTVATDFLPDKERAEKEAALRAALKAEWEASQAAVKAELIEVVYSWWDGTGHRRSIVVSKGTSIGRFLERVRQELASRDAPALAGVSSEGLLYIKEDSIIPHNLSFYDLITTQARGKSGPLFRFDVHDDLVLASDARVGKDSSHPGKVVERRWYERNKHIFPASHWELYDPAAAAAKK